MSVDGFTEIFNTVYIAKKLHDTGKYGLARSSLSDLLDYDDYYGNMYGLIENLFKHHYSRFDENCCIELHILSDPVIVDFFILSGKYGKCNNIPDEDNPYIKEAHQETRNKLNISHCLDWKLMGYTEPKRKYHSRLGLFISNECGCLDIGVLAYRLIELHRWFEDKCIELQNILYDGMTDKLQEGAIAA